MTRTPSARDTGQAAVEFALVLPMVALLVLGLVQVIAVARDQLAVEHAAREAARAAAVSLDPEAAALAAATAAVRLEPLDVTVGLTSGGPVTTSDRADGFERVTATVRYRSTTRVPLIGSVVGPLEVVGSATMMREPPP